MLTRVNFQWPSGGNFGLPLTKRGPGTGQRIHNACCACGTIERYPRRANENRKPQMNCDTAGGALWIRQGARGVLDPPQSWGGYELNDLRKEYREYSQRSLDKCFSYLNFYIGLLAALLAATLTGLLQVQPGDPRALLLLTGPAAAVVLARLGYQSFRVFNRRYVEAWVTEINLQGMLGTGHMGERDSIGRPTV